MQLELAASVVPQLLTSRNDASPVPLSTIEVRLTGVVVLLLVTVTVCAALVLFDACDAKVNEVAESVSVAGLTPVPVRATDCVVGLALSVKTSVADLAPKAVGAKRVSTVQLAATARELGQLLISVKEVRFVPPNAIELNVSAALPELVSVMVWARL